MATPGGFVAHVLDLLSPWGGVSARRMFGGHGIFRQGVMFALIVGETLYLKTDERNRADFAAAGMQPFTYRKKQRTAPVELSYWQAPPDLLDDAEEMMRWARGALEAALAAPRSAGRRRRGVPATPRT